MATWDPNDPMLQDAVRCDLCPGIHEVKSPVEFHCTTCNIKVCSGCVGKHMSKQPDKKHDVVAYRFRNTTILLPNCTVHTDLKCSLHCRDCSIAICNKCLVTSHNTHEVQDITDLFHDMKKIIENDNIELEKSIIPEYQKNESKSEELLSKTIGDYGNLKSFIYKTGQDWHREVDVVTNKITEDVEIMEKKDLGLLKNQLTEMKTLHATVRDTLQKNREILKSNKVDDVIFYKSRNEEFRQIPPHTIISPPAFKPLKIQGTQLLPDFGKLTASSQSEIEGFVMKKLEEALSLAKVLDKPNEILSFDTTCTKLCAMICLSNDDLWINGDKQVQIMRYNNKGNLLETHVAISQTEDIFSMTVTDDDDLVYTDGYTVTRLKKQTGQTETILKQQNNYTILAICISKNGDILAIMGDAGKKIKVTRYGRSTMKWEKINDNEGQPLAKGRYPLFIAENKSNQDICVCDYNGKSVIMLDKNGKLRFRYQGNPSSKKYPTFEPCKIITDRLSHILVLEVFPNDCIHVLDHNGHFISYIDIGGLQLPACLCVNNQDLLVVGEWDTKKVKCFKYLE